MSGYDDILPWALENYDVADYDDYVSWYSDVYDDFLDNGRLPLDEILDSDEIRDLEESFYEAKGKDIPMTQIEVQDHIDEFRDTGEVHDPEPDVRHTDEPPEAEPEPVSFTAKIGKALKGFFGKFR